MTARYDAIVIGAGPAGSTAALLLTRAGWSVVLIERTAFPRRKVCGEYLSPTNFPLFDALAIRERFDALAGPPVRRVGLFAGKTVAHAMLPVMANSQCGRALAREHLDTWLRDQAERSGVQMMQPWNVDALTQEAGFWQCRAYARESGAVADLTAPVVIAAHGSWEPGPLPTQIERGAPAPDELLAFKAHFANAGLPDGLMPLLAFPGGYGGMVHCDDGRVSLSCCIRRDQLALIRQRYQADAGEAVLAHIAESCVGVHKALASAERLGPWLAAGPIRPGVRVDSHGGIFRVGNAAGEAHPVIAEGISMALQSSWLLTVRLIAWKNAGSEPAGLQHVQKEYATLWRRNFVSRIRVSSVIANWAMRPATVSMSLPFVRCFPSVLTWGARASGKANMIVQKNQQR